jgi:hypothetical protein
MFAGRLKVESIPVESGMRILLDVKHCLLQAAVAQINRECFDTLV